MTKQGSVSIKEGAARAHAKRVHAFQKTVWDFYAAHGRRHLPWRKTHKAYNVWVSEIMLQQTQVARVIEKYRAFMELFPTVEALAAAPLADVLRAWQGLGYNRRAKLLHACSQKVTLEYKGKFPKEGSALRALPGIGPYTSSAIQAFAWNIATPLIETNVRTVFLYHFFPGREGVHDNEILALVEETLPHDRARDWYAALMDYGTYLKETIGNPNVRSQQYARQSSFKGSDREIRGAILRLLANAKTNAVSEAVIVETLEKAVKAHPARIDTQLEKLVAEGMVTKVRKTYRLG